MSFSKDLVCFLLIVTHTLKLGISEVKDFLLTSNGTLITYGTNQQADSQEQRPVLHQYNLETGQLIYSKETTVTGAIEIKDRYGSLLLLSDG